MQKTSIEWTHRPGTVGMTWNPIRARIKGQSPKARTGTFCTKISPGCTNCHASVINKRFGTGLSFTVPNLEIHEFVLDERFLAQPIQQKKPATIFVGDMFDLWHEAIPAEMIAEVLRVALKTPRHTFQFLTKRAERMQRTVNFAQEHWGVKFGEHMWFGVSVEDQTYADARIPFLQDTKCAVHFLSVEPMLAEVNLSLYLQPDCVAFNGISGEGTYIHGIDWVICGGESGPGARPFNLAWAESLLTQCQSAHVPFFMKQLGSKPFLRREQGPTETKLPGGSMRFASLVYESTIPLRDRKGGDPLEWPEHLRVREFPASQKAEAVPA